MDPKNLILFRVFLIKPYTKIYAIFLGIAMAIMYKNLYKLEPDSKLKKNKLIRITLYLVSFTVFWFVILFPFPVQSDPT